MYTFGSTMMAAVRLSTPSRLLAFGLAIILAVPSAHAGDFTVHAAYTTFQEGGESWGFGMKAGLPLIEVLELELRGAYYPTIVDKSVPDLEFIPLEAGLSLNVLPEGPITPYASIGGGYAYLDAGHIDVDDSWTFYAGGGIEVRIVDPLAFTVEALYRRVGEINYSRSKDMKPDSAAVNIGLALRW